MRRFFSATLGLGLLAALFPIPGHGAQPFQDAPIPRASRSAVTLGRDLDGAGDPDEITIRVEVIEVTEEVYPGLGANDRLETPF